MASEERKKNRRGSTEFLADAGQLAQLRSVQKSNDAILHVPVTVCGLALGLTNLGHDWLTFAGIIFPASNAVFILACIVAAVTALIAAGLIGLYIAKIIAMGPLEFVDHLQGSANDSSRLVTGTMAMMSIGYTLAAFEVYWLGGIIWFLAVLGHIGILCIFLPQAFQMGVSDIDDVNAAWVVPTIGLSLASGTGIAIGVGGWAAVFFWFGLLSALYFYPLALYRCYFWDPPVLDGLVFTYVVFLAPPSLLMLQFMAIGGDLWEPFPLTHLLFCWLLAALVLVCCSVPKICSVDFNTTAVAMTFPFDLAAKGTLLFWLRYYSSDSILNAPLLLLAIILFFVANFVVIYVTVRMAAMFADWYNQNSPFAASSAPDPPQAGYQQEA